MPGCGKSLKIELSKYSESAESAEFALVASRSSSGSWAGKLSLPLLLAGQLWLLLVALAEQVRVELVDVVHLLAADVAPPRIALAVAALVQEVQRLVGELDPAEVAGEDQLAVEHQIAILAGRRDRPVADGRRVGAIAGTRGRRRGRSTASSGSGAASAAINPGRSCAGAIAQAVGQHAVVVVVGVATALQRSGVPGDPVVGLGADASLKILAQERLQWRDLVYKLLIN